MQKWCLPCWTYSFCIGFSVHCYFITSRFREDLLLITCIVLHISNGFNESYMLLQQFPMLSVLQLTSFSKQGCNTSGGARDLSWTYACLYCTRMATHSTGLQRPQNGPKKTLKATPSSWRQTRLFLKTGSAFQRVCWAFGGLPIWHFLEDASRSHQLPPEWLFLGAIWIKGWEGGAIAQPTSHGLATQVLQQPYNIGQHYSSDVVLRNQSVFPFNPNLD